MCGIDEESNTPTLPQKPFSVKNKPEFMRLVQCVLQQHMLERTLN
jgi:hypothetical protein